MPRIGIGIRIPLPVEALQHQYLRFADRLHACTTHLQAGRAGEFERGVLDALHVVLVLFLGKLCQVDAVAVFDRDLGARATHAGARLQAFQQLVRQLAGLFELRSRLGQGFELVRAVEGLGGARGLYRKPETQVASPIVGPVKQVFHFGNVCLVSFQTGLDDPAAPCVRTGVAQGTRYPLELGELHWLVGQLQVVRVKLDDVVPRKITLAVGESALECARTHRLDFQRGAGHPFEGAWQLGVDVTEIFICGHGVP